MLRKIRPASLLLTAAAAVSAAASAGCVSVSTPDGPDHRPSPSASAPETRPDGRADRPIRQTPAGDGMRRTGSTPRPGAPRSPVPESPPRRAAVPPAPAKPAPRVPAPRAEAGPPPAPRAPAPTDVCALGKRYGGWDPDSPQSAICRNVYGG